MMRQYQIFGSQTVIPHLAKQLQSPAFVVEIKEGTNGREYFFSSNYTDIILTAKSSSSLPRPLFLVLKLIDVTFDRNGYEQKAEVCADGILAILSGIARAKYKEASISRTIEQGPFSTVKRGKILDIIQGKSVTRHSIDIQTRAVLTLSEEALEMADRREPTSRKMWEWAMKNEKVARALYYLSEVSGEDRFNFYKVYEEIKEDAGHDKLKEWVGDEKKIIAFEEWANDDEISGKLARHSRSAAQRWVGIFRRERGSYTRYKTRAFPGSPCPLDFHDIIQRWVAAKR